MTTLIAGASSGLGFELAKRLQLKEEKLAICSRWNIRAVAEQFGPNVYMQEANIADSIDFGEFIYHAEKQLGPITHAVCTAGLLGEIGMVSEVNDYNYIVQNNLAGPMNFCHGVLSSMIKNNYGKIILLSGGGSTNPRPGFAAYAATKAGLVRFAETLAMEVIKYNIDVNCVSPGIMNTNMLEHMLAAGPEKIGKEEYDRFLAYKQNKRTFDAPIELIEFLLSKESDGISGKLISAVWDDWKKLTKDDTLKNLYTLRRVT